MANLNDVLQGLVNINSKMANNINNLLDSIGEGLLDIGELTVSNGAINIKGATILVDGSNITIDFLTAGFSGNKICFLEYRQDKTIRFKVLDVVDADFNYDLSQLNTTSKHFEVARQYSDVFEDRRITSMASKDNTIVGALNGALKAIDYNDELDLEINMDILSRVSAVESDIQLLDIKKADISYVDDVLANVDIDIDLDGVVTAVDVGEIEGIENPYITREDLDVALEEALEGFGGSENTVSIVKDSYITDANDVMNIQGIRFTKGSTSNLPSNLDDDDSKWGVLKTYIDSEGDGIQEYTATFGGWSGTIFRRYIQTSHNTFGDWKYILDGESWGYSLQTNDKTIIGAINELFQSANNGKELIADAIGEPVSSEDTFQAMSNDINSLLSTFKTNMMNNGITVESGDRFKQLIDKLATMVEEGSGKGIQFASGQIDSDYYKFANASSTHTFNFNEPLNFTPTYLFIRIPYVRYSSDNGTAISRNTIVSNLFNNSIDEATQLRIGCSGSDSVLNIKSTSSSNFVIEGDVDIAFGYSSSTGYDSDYYIDWYAFGVGEEDTTLRDSLASILQDSGVEVSEEDNMASLITKVDTELDEATSNKNRLYDLMLEGGYEVNSSMNLDSLLDLLVLSGISVGDIKQIACGSNHTFILKTNGSLWCCGYNNYGQLGLGNTTNRTSFTQVTTNMNDDVIQVACGQSHTIIQKKDGTLWACGYNYYGQLGLGDTTDRTTFTRVANNINNDVKQIACGDNHTFILKIDGSIWGCGYNYYGQLGLNNTNNKTSFTQVTPNINNDVKQIVCGSTHTFILKNDGSIWSCGYNYNGQLGLGDPANKTMFLKVTTNINNDVKQIACGEYHTFILKNDGSIWSCGYNNSGQLGLGDTTQRSTFTQVTTNINNDVKQIVCGSTHTFILKTNGTLWACGYNGYGQLGLNDTTNRNTFTQVTTNINNDVKQVICGDEHTFILKNDSSILSCGYNRFGQLGFSNTDVTTFTQVPRAV